MFFQKFNYITTIKITINYILLQKRKSNEYSNKTYEISKHKLQLLNNL